jgi:hypothetical protein
VRQLRPAGGGQNRQILADQSPEHGGRDRFVTVPENITDYGNVPPWNLWMPGLDVIRQMSAGLGDDLNTALNESDASPIRLKIIDREIAKSVTDAVGCFDNIEQPECNGTPWSHQKMGTASASTSARSRL